MKFAKYLLTVTTAILFISACQKELDFVTDGLSHGSLKSDSTGDCLPSIINGIYKADSVLNTSHYIDVQVNINTAGTYEIKSDTVNGYSFKGTGSLGIMGLNTVRLYATGKPLVAGTDIFTIRFDNSICRLSVVVIGANTGAAVFTLEGAPLACNGALTTGTYTQGVALDINNTVTLSVDVLDTGTYVFGAASVNGMLFTGTGVFTTLGVQSVTLNGVGVPLAAGTFNVTVVNNNGTSTCTFSVTVATSGSGSAVYTLNTTSGGCSGATYSGTYNAGTALTINNAVILNVNVTTVGNWSIATNTDNGMSFSGSGVFTVTGPQPVVLTGSGTPLAGGVFNFTSTAGSSTCIFSITVNGTVVNGEYILYTANSNYSQRMVGGAPIDTFYFRVSSSTFTTGGFNYYIHEQMQSGSVVDSSYYRKNAGKYYNLQNMQALGFDNANKVDYLILDSSVAIGGSWVADLGSNAIGGMPVTVKVTCNIVDKAATAVIAGNNYSNVIKVHYVFSYNNGSASTDFQGNDIWFAKGKGIIYVKVNDIPITTSAELETTRIEVF